MHSSGKKILKAKLEKAKIRDVYRKLAPKYDLWAGLAESRARARALEVANIHNGNSVLEVAVGTGLLFEKVLTLNPQGKNVGIDITEEMLERARSRAKGIGATNYTLEVGDAYALEYPDNSFDVVLNGYMFDLIPEKDFLRILEEFNRVLCPGGRLVLINMTKGEHWYNAVWELLYGVNPASFGGCRGVYLKTYVEGAGFVNARREYISQLTFPSEVIWSRKPEGTS